MQNIISLIPLNNFIILFAFLIVFPKNLVAQSPLDNFWKEEITNRNIKVNNTSYCFIDREGKLQGFNITKNFPIASLSKIMTSLASLRFFGNAYHQFTTTAYYSAKLNVLHLESNGDPTINDEKLWIILSKLNEKNIFHVNSVSFNSQFYFMPHIHRFPHYEHQWVEGNVVKVGPYIPTPIETSKFLNSYLSTTKYDENIKKQFQQVSDTNSEISKNLNFNFDALNHSTDNPLLSADDLQTIKINSQPLISILKTLNSISNNPMTDILHYSIGGEKTILDSLRGILPPDDLKKMRWFTGSGLPLKVMEQSLTTRNLNLLSCKGMLFVKDHFRHLVDALALNSTFFVPRPNEIFSQGLLKTLPVSGQEGTISSFRDFTNIFVGKTGTLNEAKMLSTFISAKSGVRLLTMMGTAPKKYLNRLSDAYKLMLNQAIKAFRGASPFEYTPGEDSIAESMEKKAIPKLASTQDLINKINHFVSPEQKLQFLINDSNCQWKNCYEIVRSLVQKIKLNTNKIDEDPLLLHAVSMNKTFLVKELLAAGVDANYLVYNSKTPLYFLSVHQDLEMVKTVFENSRINVHLKNGQGLSIRDYAQKYAYSDDVKNYIKSKVPSL